MIFDLDGTLVDSVPDLAAAVDAMLSDQQCSPVGEEKVRLWVGNGAPMLVRRALADAGGLPSEQVDEVLFQASLKRFYFHYRRLSGHYAKLYSGVEEGLQLLRQRKIPMVVVTNKPDEFVPGVLQKMGIESYFEEWLGGDTLPVKKPDPAPLNYLLKKWQLTPDDALMVGDSRNDIEAAKAAGMQSLALTYGYNHGRPVAREEPTWIADNIGQFFNEHYSLSGGGAD